MKAARHAGVPLEMVRCFRCRCRTIQSLAKDRLERRGQGSQRQRFAAKEETGKTEPPILILSAAGRNLQTNRHGRVSIGNGVLAWSDVILHSGLLVISFFF